MPSLTIEHENESERPLIGQALALVADFRRTALEAPHRTVLATCAAEAVEKGRRSTVEALGDALRRRVAEVEAPQNGRAARGRKGGGRAGS